MKDEIKSNAAILRQKAEALLIKKPSKFTSQLSESDLLKLLHENEVQQIELELQNQELMNAQEKVAELSNEKYAGDFLPQYKEHLEFALSGTNDGIWDVNMGAGSVYLSPRGCEILGYKTGDLQSIVKNWDQLVHPEDLPATNKALTAYIEGKTPMLIVEQRLKTSTGGFKWILVRGKAVSHDSNGKILRMIGTHTDISEQKQSDRALHESLERYKKLAQISPVGIFHTDENGHTTFVNQMWCQITGLSIEDALGDNWLNAVHPDDKEKLVNGWSEASQFHKESYSEYRFIRPDGSIAWVIGQAIPETNIEGQTIGYIGTITDITERKKAEESIRKQIEEFETIFNLVPAQIWYKDTHNNIVRVNRRVCDDLGMTIDKIEGHSAEELFPAFAQKYFNDDLEVFNTQKPKLGIVEQVNTFKGEIRWVHSDKVPVFGKDGKVNGLIAFVQDITEHKRAEKEITMLAHSLKSINECVSITDLEDKILFVNDSFLKTYGYEPNELIGKNMSIVRSKNSMQEVVTDILQATIKGEWQGELMNRRKDGSEFPIFLSTTIIKDKENQTLGLIGVATDISERKHSEMALLNSQNLLHTLVQTIPDLIWLKDAKGVYLLCNTMFERFVGAKEAEIIGKTDYDFVDRQLADFFREQDHNAIAAGKPTSNEEWVTFADDGRRACLDTIKTPMYDSNGAIMGVLGIGRDITERKQSEDELINAKERAEESDKLKTSFLNNISHEIRTPFNGILGFLTLIQEDNLSTSERDDYIDVINQSSYRLMNTINDIVEISQIQAGQMILTESKTNILKLTNELYNQFKTEAERKGLKLYINNDLPVTKESIYTDSFKLNAILTNILSNAIKFTKTGSIEIGYQFDIQPTPFLRFFVKDTGVGISENKLQAIFDRFIQADGTNTRLFEGSGLGLSIAKAYVEMLGGKIWVESEEGKGSVFYFTIPYNVEPAGNKTAKDMASGGSDENHNNHKFSGLKILIAEDDDGSAMLIKIALNLVSKEMLEVKTGIDAIEACRNNPDIDLVLMDIKMTGMNGYEATRQIRQFNTEVIIIAQTAFALNGDREKAIAAGCDDYISKPFDRGTMTAVVEKHFKNRESNK